MVALPGPIIGLLPGVLVALVHEALHAIDGLMVPGHQEGRLLAHWHDVVLEVFRIPHEVDIAQVEG